MLHENGKIKEIKNFIWIILIILGVNILCLIGYQILNSDKMSPETIFKIRNKLHEELAAPPINVLGVN